MIQITQTEYDELLAAKKDLAAGKEIVGDFVTFLGANANGTPDANMDIACSETVGDGFCQLMNAMQEWSGFKAPHPDKPV